MDHESEHVVLNEKTVAARFEDESLGKRLGRVIIGLRIKKKRDSKSKFSGCCG